MITNKGEIIQYHDKSFNNPLLLILLKIIFSFIYKQE
jgi:hypothetical protein